MRGRRRGQLNKKKSAARGYTLVEVIVCFALIGLFMAAAATVLLMYMDTAYKMSSMNRTQMLTTTLMDTISGEVTSAADTKFSEDNSSELRIIITQEAGKPDRLSFTDKNGYPVDICVNDKKQLVLEYTEPGKDVPTEWGYGNNVYRSNEVTRLIFNTVTRDGAASTSNLLEVTLTVRDSKTEYEETRKTIIQCYNLKDNQIGQ